MSTQIEQRRAIHVLIVGLTGVLAESISEVIQTQPDMVLLGHTQNWTEIPAALGLQADVLVIKVELIEFVPESCVRLLHTFPHLKILTLTTHDDSGVGCWLSLYHYPLLIISRQMLVDSIRQFHTLSSLQRF
ncbi:hypothetical protein H6F89_14240 [Cyanobacteria bacterium FACHB-63]|nr:hypothetical protein [Cyanobacteria bacterium FACHB-63]